MPKFGITDFQYLYSDPMRLLFMLKRAQTGNSLSTGYVDPNPRHPAQAQVKRYPYLRTFELPLVHVHCVCCFRLLFLSRERRVFSPIELMHIVQYFSAKDFCNRDEVLVAF